MTEDTKPHNSLGPYDKLLLTITITILGSLHFMNTILVCCGYYICPPYKYNYDLKNGILWLSHDRMVLVYAHFTVFCEAEVAIAAC